VAVTLDPKTAPLALLGAEQINVHLPEHRDGEQIEHREPNEKDPAHPHCLLGARPVQQGGKDNDVGGGKAVGDRDEAAARQLFDKPGIRNVHQHHGDQGAGEQPLQIVDPPGDACLFPDRPHDIIG